MLENEVMSESPAKSENENSGEQNPYLMCSFRSALIYEYE